MRVIFLMGNLKTPDDLTVTVYTFIILQNYMFISSNNIVLIICVNNINILGTPILISSCGGFHLRWTLLRPQLSPDDLGQPLVEVYLLAVNLPVLFLLDIARPPLVVGEEGILKVVAELSLLDGGYHLADECV